MKKASLLILSLILTLIPCCAEEIPNVEQEASYQPKIFIYHIPEEQKIELFSRTPEEETKETYNITSDDITADTSIPIEFYEYDVIEDATATVSPEYGMGEMYSDVLKGYATYDEYEEETISLEDTLEDYQTIHIKNPKKVASFDYSLEQKNLVNKLQSYSKYDNMEYSIAPRSSTNYRTLNGFSAGTLFDQCIDYAELESTTGVFSRYDGKHFAVTSAFKKTVNTTNNNYNDNFSFAPELKINQYLTLKEITSADTVKNRKKIEFILSINPFGKKDIDRMRLELGANTTFDHTNAVLRRQLKFSTSFKL